MVRAINEKLTESKLLQTIILLVTIIATTGTIFVSNSRRHGESEARLLVAESRLKYLEDHLVDASIRGGVIGARISAAETKIDNNSEMKARLAKLEDRPSIPDYFEKQFSEFKTDVKIQYYSLTEKMDKLANELSLIKIEIAGAMKQSAINDDTGMYNVQVDCDKLPGG